MRLFHLAATTFQTKSYFDSFWHADTYITLQQNSIGIARLS